MRQVVRHLGEIELTHHLTHEDPKQTILDG